MQEHRCMFLHPLFILVLFKLSVVSRCPSNGDKENERGLDIISIEMSLLHATSKAQPQCRSSHYTTFSTCKWQCHQMLSFHQSSQGGHEYTKGKAESGCLPQLYLAQLYRLSFLLWASTFCFSLKGTIQGSPRLNQGRSRILDLSSGPQMQVKCGHQMSSFFYIIAAWGQGQQGSGLHPFFLLTLCHIPWTEVLFFTQTQQQTTRLLQPPSFFSLQQPACPFLYPSCQIIAVN